MQLTGTLHIQGMSGEPMVLERFEAAMARVQRLDDQAIEALCTIIDASDATDVVRKLHGFVAALVCPAPVLARAFEREPADFNRFCLQLSAFRAFLERLENGASPRDAGTAVERARREWLGHELRVCGAGAEAAEPDDDELEEMPVDVYDAEGELDPGAVRAEIDRLLRHLNVAPERVDITILPEEQPPPGP